MKQGWEIKTLGQLADVKGGKRVPKGYRLETIPTDYPYIRVTDFNDNGSVDLNDLHYINKDVYEQIRNYTITTSDLYISIAGTIGKTGIIPKELDGANLTENACKLVFKVDVNPKLVYYFTKTESFLKQAGLNTRVAAMPKLALTRLSTISLLFPESLPEQQRIVAILDEAFAAIAKAKANAEQNLRNAKELFESYLQSVFENKGEGWEEKLLIEVCDQKRGITYGVIKLGEEYLSGIPCLRTSNVRWLGIDTEGIKRISPSLSSEYSRTIIKGGEVLVNVRGTLGGVAVASLEMVGWNVSREVSVVPVITTIINPFFLSYQIGSNNCQNWLTGVKKGAAYTGINLEDLRLMPLAFPNMEVQLNIVQQLEFFHAKTKKLETIYRQKISDLAELKTSILQKAFSGELKTINEVAV